MFFAARKTLAFIIVFAVALAIVPSTLSQTKKKSQTETKKSPPTTQSKPNKDGGVKDNSSKDKDSNKSSGKSKAASQKPSTKSGQNPTSKNSNQGKKGEQGSGKKEDQNKGKSASQTDSNKAPNNKKNDDQTGSGATTKSGKSKKSKTAAEKRAAAAEKRRLEREERERRARLAREAEERRRAFERGLREETAANISRDNLDGEDMAIRRVAVQALAGKAGTVVVMDPRTGQIYSIVNQDWAVKRGFKPCSTIKLVSGIAAINENLVGDGGVLTDRSFPMNLDDALAYSNNTYFQRAGINFGRQKMVDYARAFGLGTPTGINLPGESAGRMPTNNNDPRIYSHGDDFEVTPLQLAVMVSAITNGGYLPIPRVTSNSFEKANFGPQWRGRVDLPSEVIKSVIPGMVGAAQYGTARNGVQRHQEVAGKTGSCIGGNTWVGLFASVAPVDDPKFAVVVITQGDSERGRHAASIAGKIFNALEDRMPIGNRPNIASIPRELQPQRRINPSQSSRFDNESNEGPEVKTINTGSVRQATTTEELFPPIVITRESSGTRPRIVGQN